MSLNNNFVFVNYSPKGSVRKQKASSVPPQPIVQQQPPPPQPQPIVQQQQQQQQSVPPPMNHFTSTIPPNISQNNVNNTNNNMNNNNNGMEGNMAFMLMNALMNRQQMPSGYPGAASMTGQQGNINMPTSSSVPQINMNQQLMNTNAQSAIQPSNLGSTIPNNININQQAQHIPLSTPNTASYINTILNTADTAEVTPKKRKTPTKPSSSSKKAKVVDLNKKLKSLEKDELIQLITSLPEKFPSKYDTLQQDILIICPDADVDGAIQDLEQLRRNVEKAFPRAKYGTNRDDYAFKRVKPTLTQFKKSVTEKTTEVKNGQNWSIMCRYLNKLMEVVDDLPVFDAEKNNSIRDALFKHCATNYTAMLKARDCNLTSEEITSIESTIEEYQKSKDEVFSTTMEKLSSRKSK